MTSIRSRIALAVVGCTAGAVLVAAILVGATTRAMLLRSLDDRLQARRRFPWTVPRAPTTEHDAQPPAGASATPAATGSPSSSSQWSSSWPYAEIHDPADGSEIWRGPSLPQGESLAALGVRPGDPIETVTLADGRPARLLAATVEATVRPPFRWRGGDRDHGGDRGNERGSERSGAPERKKIDVYLAVDASEIFEELHHLVWILAALWSGATALSWAVALWLRKTVLEPVESLSRTIQDLSPTNLAARVPAHEAPLELQSVVARLNELLSRVDSAFSRERSTIANLAHELRNPLSALRAKLEFGLLQEPDQQHRALEAGVVVTRRMQSMINGLLTLTRIEAGQETPAARRADVVELLRDAWSSVDPMARSRTIHVQWRVPESCELETSPTHLALVFANLFDNAVAHGTQGGTVVVELVTKGGSTLLRINNPFESGSARAGGGSAPGARGGSFEPLWRRDPARSGDDHCGLGLALCDRVVRLLGGRLAVRQAEGRFAVEVELPGLPVAPDPHSAVAHD